MKFKYFLFLSLGAFLVTLIACSDESDAPLLGDGPEFISERSSQNLSISYEMTTTQSITPTTGTLEDLCAIDVKMITIPSSTTIVTTTVGEDGDLCITINENPSNGRNGEGKDQNQGTTTKLCNGIVTYTAADGTTTSFETDYDVSFFQSLALSYYYTEAEKDSAMNVMILDAKNNGATTEINGNALTITSKDQDGNTTKTVYDMKNHVMISSQTTDRNGQVLTKTLLTYTCKPDGTIVPNFVAKYNYKDKLICSDPVYTVEQVNFNNYQINL